ncbi:hypothetical protein [Paenibacillus sp. ISL-20]|uniref:hypothetical protein n=1 Tax=Paenibacillus sp. ISL-20 TaxID=2819163 RepID=UPI001BE8505D|nr:hypothetical protein [Paenibacillus sp. ISL-20]MBT2765788.1 hypothetical protein [Paenibacillus sp. ISL-20]
MDWREYTGLMDLDISELGKAVQVNTAVLDAVKKKHPVEKILSDFNAIGLNAGLVLTIFGRAAFGPWAGVVGASYTTWEVIKAIVSSFQLEKALEEGLRKLNDALVFMAQNTNRYKRVELDVAFLEYIVTTSSGRAEIRYIQQASINRLQTMDGNWIGQS